MRGYFISGIDTEIGKTIFSAIITQALQADYWKPIQSGDLHHTDTQKVQNLVEHPESHFFPETYRLNQPMSPHASAAADGIQISLDRFETPITQRPLIIEGAGGLLVPLNEQNTLIDLMEKIGFPVILVSKHRLGNINHTLLSIEALKNRGIPIKGIVFNGSEIPGTESIIANFSGVDILGTLPTLEQINKSQIAKLAKAYEFLRS